MFGHKLTDRVKRVLYYAREEAGRLKHPYVGTEHILLALIRDETGVAARMLANLGVDGSELRREIEEGVKEGTAEPVRGSLPYTSRAKKVIELAMDEAVQLDHEYIGTEHVLLGLLREEKGIAAQVLERAGVTLAATRAEALRLSAGGAPGAPVTSGVALRFDVHIDDASDRSIYEQIVSQLQEAVAMGKLCAGDRLPAVRQLADQLDIAPGTVARAYSELERRGIVVTDGARGTRVAERPGSPVPAHKRPDSLVGLLRPVAVAAYHLGATAAELRHALDEAMHDIFGDSERQPGAA
jgi:DNA-binding transcriptional regulator YhcF (GntR family)